MVRGMSALTTTLVPLRTGGAIPQVGLGVWQAPRGATYAHAVAAALRLGYRHIDTARIYGNEADVGAAIRDSGVPRDAGLRHHEAVERRPGLRRRRCARSMRASSGSGSTTSTSTSSTGRSPASASTRGARSSSCEPTSRARAIGVSNFLVPHLEELLGDGEGEAARSTRSS